MGNKYKDLYEFIPQSLEMMPFVLDWILIYRNWSIALKFHAIANTNDL